MHLPVPIVTQKNHYINMIKLKILVEKYDEKCYNKGT